MTNRSELCGPQISFSCANAKSDKLPAACVYCNQCSCLLSPCCLARLQSCTRVFWVKQWWTGAAWVLERNGFTRPQPRENRVRLDPPGWNRKSTVNTKQRTLACVCYTSATCWEVQQNQCSTFLFHVSECWVEHWVGEWVNGWQQINLELSSIHFSWTLFRDHIWYVNWYLFSGSVKVSTSTEQLSWAWMHTLSSA